MTWMFCRSAGVSVLVAPLLVAFACGFRTPRSQCFHRYFILVGNYSVFPVRAKGPCSEQLWRLLV